MHTLKQNLKLGSLFLATIFVGCSPKFTEETKEGFNLVKNENGATLGYSQDSGVSILTVDQMAFKDLNKNGTLDPYEDWRLSADERAKDSGPLPGR